MAKKATLSADDAVFIKANNPYVKSTKAVTGGVEGKAEIPIVSAGGEMVRQHGNIVYVPVNFRVDLLARGAGASCEIVSVDAGIRFHNQSSYMMPHVDLCADHAVGLALLDMSRAIYRGMA